MKKFLNIQIKYMSYKTQTHYCLVKNAYNSPQGLFQLVKKVILSFWSHVRQPRIKSFIVVANSGFQSFSVRASCTRRTKGADGGVGVEH